MNKLADIQPEVAGIPPITEPAQREPSRLVKIFSKVANRELAYDIIETIILAVVIWFAVNLTTARFIVEGSSMEPTLHTGQYLLVDRLSYQFGQPQHGDVVVFRYPMNPVDDYVKRVIGIPGDEVIIRSKTVYVNGQALSEPYIQDDGMVLNDGYQGKWVVPEDHYFVMGDNRNHSSDSRSWGLLARTDMIGKAWLSYWPPQEWGLIHHIDVTSP